MALKKDKIMLANGFPTLPDFDAMETGEATKQDIYDTQGIVAYVQKTLKADKAYTVGDDDTFIYNGKLYRVTANIAKDATIVLEGAGANAELDDGIQDQIDDMQDQINALHTFSTTETNTGEVWVDGKTIYRKVYTNVNLPSNTTTDVASLSDLNIGSVVRLWGIAHKDTESGIQIRPVPFAASSTNDIRLNIALNVLQLQTFTAWESYLVDIIVEYTKAS